MASGLIDPPRPLPDTLSAQGESARRERSGPRQPPLPAQQVLTSLRRVVQALDIESKELERRTGLTTAQVVLLQAVQRLGQVTSSRLAAEASLSQATVTAVLDRLEARGLLQRYRSQQDRRIVHARLTEAGRAALRKAPRLLHRRFQARFADLPEARQAELVQACLLLEALLIQEG